MNSRKKTFWVKHLKGTGGKNVALLVLVNPNRWTNSQTKWDVQVWQTAHYRTIIPSCTFSDNLLVTSNIEIPFHTPPTSRWVLRCFEILTETPNNAAAHPGSGWKMGKLRNRVGVLIVSVVLLILEPPGLHKHIQSISVSSSSHPITGVPIFDAYYAYPINHDRSLETMIGHVRSLYTIVYPNHPKSTVTQCASVLHPGDLDHMSLATPPVSWESG